MNKPTIQSKSYADVLDKIIEEISRAKITVARVVNAELSTAYWNIGKMIWEKQQKEGWGESVIERLSLDIKKHTGMAGGFSPRNLWFMKQFYEEYGYATTFLKQLVSELKLKQLVSELKEPKDALALLPWGHQILLMQKTGKDKERIYYFVSSALNGWSRAILLNQIKANAYEHHRVQPGQHNFEKVLPLHLHEQANERLKSNYNLEFLGINRPVLEKEFERRLLEKLKDFMLELGYGFTFVGNQYRLKLNRKEYFVDLLFFHRYLRCLVAIDLKIGEFEPEFAGKMNFYLNLLDTKIKLPDENPSIGIILCAEKNSVEVDFALKGIDKPIAVSEYQLQKTIPKKWQKQLPTAQELAAVIKAEFKKEKRSSRNIDVTIKD